MTPQTFLHDLATRGVILTADTDQLDVDAPDDALTDELLALLRKHRGELLEYLTHHCPVCDLDLRIERGQTFVHRWCAQPGHFDSWRAIDGLKLKQTDAP